MVSMFAAEEDRFESRNLDDSDAHSEATGTTEEDLRPVKVSCSPSSMHAAFIPGFNCKLIHAIAPAFRCSLMHACIHLSVHLCQPSKPIRITW